MGKKKYLLLAVVLIFVLLLPLYGCGGGDEGESEDPAKETAATEDVNIDDLFGKAKTVEGFSCDYLITEGTTGSTLEGKMFFEGKKSRMEINSPEGQMIQLVDMEASKAYSYMPEQKMAFELDLSEIEGQDSPKDYVDNADTTDAEFLGNEEVEGIKCSKWSLKAKEEGDAKVIMWLHSEYGLPVKVETTINNVVSTMLYKNLKVEDIPDDMFELPAGVQVQSMADMMQNLPAAP